ncbi:uncharacterized protein LOC134069469 [Sardina pilchardus]|uniref:uncharacterized protein LOC134069469 n=1 Tax=Sardina pilchardus TaxID=27697 RepID=UPI002E0E5EB6
MEHLSKRVWNHTILLFTYGEYLGDTTIEQYIESEGENLQWLVEMCKNRYLVIDHENIVNGTPGAMLVEKIEAMLAANNGCHFEMDEERLEEIEVRRKQQDEKANIKMMVREKRDTLRSQMGNTHSPELRIVLLGSKYAGKSSSGNSILGQQEFGTTGPTAMYMKRRGWAAVRVVTVVDTPGWWADHSLDQSDEVTTHQIVLSLSLCPPGPHAILLAVRLTTAFTEARRSSVQQHLEQIDPLIWGHSIVLFTCGDFLGDATIEQYIESEGEPLQWLVEKCGNRYHVFNNDDKGDRAQVIKLLEKVEEMLAGHSRSYYQIQDRLCDEMLRRRREEENKLRERVIEEQKHKDMLGMHAEDSHLWELPAMAKKVKKKALGPIRFFSKKMKGQRRADRNDTGSRQVLHSAPEDSTVKLFSHSEINRWDPLDVISLSSSSGYGGSIESSRRSSIENISICRRSSFSASIDTDLRSIEGSMEDVSLVDEEQAISDDKDDQIENVKGNGSEDVDEYEDSLAYCANAETYTILPNSSHWVLMEPSVSTETGFPVYKHSTPSGSFECVVSGLRWVCGREVTVQYHFTDPGVYRAELAMLQYVPIGPLMDIKVLSGELFEAHLPHFACLDGSDSSLREAVRVLRGVDSSVSLETCELTRFHAKLLKPSFSLIEVLVKMGVPMKTHLDVLIYRTRVTPLTLLTYVVPRDASMIQAVEEEILEIQDAKRIKKHRPHRSIWMNSKFSLTSSCPADVSPSKITLTYIRPPDLFEVFMENVEDCFELEVISQGQSIWKVTMRSVEFGETRGVSGNSGEVMHKEKKSDRDRNNRGEGNISSMSNKDRLFMFRPDLIKRMSGGLLRDVLDRLQAQPCVVSRREAEEVLQRTSVLQDQVTFLVDVVLKKGDGASGILLSLLEELDNYLYRDLGLCEEATYL